MNIYNIIHRSERASIKLAYRLKHGMEKLARLRNHLTFLIRCQNNHLIPKGLRVRIPTKSISFQSSQRIARRTSESLLRQLIRDTRIQKVRMNREIDTYIEQLGEKMTPEQLERIKQWCELAAEEVARVTKTRQIKKYENLRAQKSGPSLEADKLVKNLSQRPLTEEEKQVLALGLNYAVTPKAIPTASIIASTEATAKQFDTDSAHKLRAGISKVLQSSKPPKGNLTSHLRRAATELRKDRNIVILPTDKGNVTVVMDKKEYIEKLEHMLEDGTYSKIEQGSDNIY